jgi:hypothetical protein
MRRLILVTAFLSHAVWASSSLVVASGVTNFMKVPAVVPFTSMGDYRVEFRIHDWSLPVNQRTAFLSWGSVYSGSRYLEMSFQPTGEICATDWVDSMPQRGNATCANVTGHRDILVRVQRFGNSYPTEAGGNGSFRLEVQDIDGTPIESWCHDQSLRFACPLQTPVTKDWSAIIGYVGNPSMPTAFSLAWLKWFSAGVPPGSPFSQESTPANLADWRFESNLNGDGTGGYKVSLQPNGAQPVYAANVSYPPVCIAGPQQVFRAGYPAQLDGTNSYSLNGDPTLTYFWQEVSGPTTVQWVSQNTGHPSAGGTVFGSYAFRLTATDSSGQSSTCTVKHGFVATDDNDVVITDNAAADVLLGPLIRYGANPWPWFDDRQKGGADLMVASFGTALNSSRNYAPFWESTKGPGTITLAAGSATAAGLGTTFTTTFCQGPSNPALPKAGIRMTVWYPDSSPEGYGLRGMTVASCQSDTYLTLSSAWGSDVSDCRGDGCGYSYDSNDVSATGSGIWTYPNGEGSNYYDVVAGLYALYYRSGLDDYLSAARMWADRWWKFRLDSGNLCNAGCGGNQPPRILSMLGMTLRALDGRTDMWPGIRKLSRYFENSGYTGLKRLPPVYDVREEAYSMALASYVALYDPDSNSRSTAATALSWAMNNLWKVTQSPDGSWQGLYSMANSWTGGTTSVTLTHGSRTVTGNGTSWASSQFPNHIVFLPTSSQPANYAAQVEGTYYAATFVDAKTLTLDRPYEGTTGTHGWMIGYSVELPAVGWGTQPFIDGILGMAFGFTAQALAETDPANAALARSSVVSIANWERNIGYRSANGGMQYMAGTVDCLAPVPESATWCTQSYAPSQARTLNAESLRTVMMAYSISGDPVLRTFADKLYNAMYAVAGYCSNNSVCVPDGQYISDLNAGGGWYVSGDPVNGKWHKFFGMLFGIGAGADWPAYRLGPTKPLRRRPVRVGFSPANVPNATAVRVTTTAPSGEIVQASCSASPCTVAIDDRQGDHIFHLEYLSASGAVLAATELPTLQGR